MAHIGATGVAHGAMALCCGVDYGTLRLVVVS